MNKTEFRIKRKKLISIKYNSFQDTGSLKIAKFLAYSSKTRFFKICSAPRKFFFFNLGNRFLTLFIQFEVKTPLEQI